MVLSLTRWIGKVAIVTGATSGIGAAVAERLVSEGLTVLGLGRRVENIQQLSKKLNSKKGVLHGLQVDLTKEEDILKAFEWSNNNLGPVHVLINSAGVFVPGTILEGKTDDWKTVFDVNVLGLSIATREACNIMKNNNINGHIIHIGSIAGYFLSVTGLNIYPGSKFAVRALTEMLRRELAKNGSKIKVTSISPGLVGTEMTTESKTQYPEIVARMKKAPILKTEDIADAIIYALSTPEHVQVHELILRPVGEYQRGS